MNNQQLDDIKDSLALLRAIAAGGAGMKRDSLILIAAGVIFGTLNFLYWLMFSGIVDAAPSVRNALWLAALVLFGATLTLIHRTPRATSIAGRAVGVALAGVGVALVIAGIALSAGGLRLQMPQLATWTFPIVLFTLYGAAWTLAAIVMKRAWFAFIAVGCYLVALLCGFTMGSTWEWLILSFGLFLLVAVPGVVMWREAKE
jgi:hypothetical protein